MKERLSIKEINEIFEQLGLMQGINKVFGVGIKINLPLCEQTYNTQIEELNLSVRSYNCLKRAGVNTIGESVEYIQKNELTCIRNLGNLSRAEIRARVCEYGYSKLTRAQKEDFIKGLLENC